VQEKEGVEFWKAIRLLEKRYGIEPLPWEAEEKKESLSSEIAKSFDRSETGEDVLVRASRLIDSLCREREITPQKCAGLWEAHDRVHTFMASGGDSLRGLEMSQKIVDTCKKVRGVKDGLL
jgi:hypothetical protein